MSHPVTFSDDDPHLADVRRLALALPEAVEKVAWGRPTFRAGERGKMFAIFERAEHTPSLLVVKPEPGEREALLAEPRFGSPAYWGPSGWVGLDLTAGDPGLDEVAELLESSYRQVALVRQRRALDARPRRARGRPDLGSMEATTEMLSDPSERAGTEAGLADLERTSTVWRGETPSAAARRA